MLSWLRRPSCMKSPVFNACDPVTYDSDTRWFDWGADRRPYPLAAAPYRKLSSCRRIEMPVVSGPPSAGVAQSSGASGGMFGHSTHRLVLPTSSSILLLIVCCQVV